MVRTTRKGVILIIDGFGDNPVPALGDRTPLEAADTPNLDRLAGNGETGLVDPIAEGVVPNTHSGAGTLMGLSSASIEMLKRGPVEAAGYGYRLKNGDVALRANLATFDQQGDTRIVRDRRAGRIDRDSDALLAGLSHVELAGNVVATLKPTDQHRGVLVFSGAGLSASVSDTDPGVDSSQTGEPVYALACEPLDHESPAAVRTAGLINEFIKRAEIHLEAHPVNLQRQRAGQLPANGLLLRGAGVSLDTDSHIRRLGIRTAVVAGCNTVLGLGGLSGFNTVNRPSFTASLDTDVNAKILAALEDLRDHDMVYVHVKAPDICAHDCKPQAKLEMLQRIDTALEPLHTAGVIVAVCADHCTDSNTGLHTADPVPSLLSDTASVSGNDSVSFGERDCASGSLGRITSEQFLATVVEALGCRIPTD
jgi:2,3-bisphosphoglycerate-independent phosphoglycerate mutase